MIIRVDLGHKQPIHADQERALCPGIYKVVLQYLALLYLTSLSKLIGRRCADATVLVRIRNSESAYTRTLYEVWEQIFSVLEKICPVLKITFLSLSVLLTL